MAQGTSGPATLSKPSVTLQRRYDAPPELHGLSVGVKGTYASARSLVTGKTLTARSSGEYHWLDLDPVGAFDAILLEG